MKQMYIFQIDVNVNRYGGFFPHFPEFMPEDDAYCPEEDMESYMHAGESVLARWVPPRLSRSSGKNTDFVSMTCPYMDIALNERALTALQPLLDGVCELLPVSYRKTKLWGLYLPESFDCLDMKRSEAEERDDGYTYRVKIDKPVFVQAKIPPRAIFRVRGNFNNYATQEFKDAVEQAGLTGLDFDFVWSSDGSKPPKAKTVKKSKSKTNEVAAPTIQRPGRKGRREQLLDTLWEEVIHYRAGDEWLDETLAPLPGESDDDDDDDFPAVNDAARILRKLIARRVSRDDLKRLCRSLAYEVVFDTLQALDEAEAVPARWAGLSEEILASDPRCGE